MSKDTVSIEDVKNIAIALKELKNQVVFVDGSILILYTNDSGAEIVRETTDVDFTLKLFSYKAWTEIQERLSQLGFHPDPFGNSINSYMYKDTPVDIMLAVDSPLGPCNRWYRMGFNSLQEIKLKDETIQVLSAPYFLATKFEAFNSRGKGYRTSHDFEDIIYILNNREDIVDEIAKADEEVQLFLQTEIRKVLSNHLFEEIIASHLVPADFDERFPIVLEKMNRIANL